MTDAPHEDAAVAAFQLLTGDDPNLAAAEPHVRELASAVKANPAVRGWLAGLFARLVAVVQDPKQVVGILSVVEGLVPGSAAYITPIQKILDVIENANPTPAPASAPAQSPEPAAV